MKPSERCQVVDDLLVDLIYDELGAEQASEVHAHLEGCETCRAAYEGLRRTHGHLAEIPSDVGQMEVSSLVSRLAIRHGRQRRLARRLAIAASLTLFVGFAVIASNLRLEVGEDQLTIAWGEEPQPVVPPKPDPLFNAEDFVSPDQLAEGHERLKADLLKILAKEIESLGRERAVALSHLGDRLESLERDQRDRFQVVESDLRALYLSVRTDVAE